MNLQESIRRILREETELPLSVKRRININDLNDLVNDIKDLIDSGYDKTDAIYDTIRQFISASGRFTDVINNSGAEQDYWDSYIEVEKPLINYVKSQLKDKTLMEEYNERQKKILTLASQVGFLKTAEMFGGVGDLLSILGDEFLSTNNKIKIIKEIVGTTDNEYITLMDMNENPIVLRDEDGVLSQLELVFLEDVAVFHYGGYKYSQDMGETYRHYEELPKDILDDIFNMVLGYYMDNLENN